jgi:hypothetical protein
MPFPHLPAGAGLALLTAALVASFLLLAWAEGPAPPAGAEPQPLAGLAALAAVLAAPALLLAAAPRHG